MFGIYKRGAGRVGPAGSPRPGPSFFDLQFGLHPSFPAGISWCPMAIRHHDRQRIPVPVVAGGGSEMFPARLGQDNEVGVGSHFSTSLRISSCGDRAAGSGQCSSQA